MSLRKLIGNPRKEMKMERLDKKLVCFEWFKNIKAYVLKAFTKDIPLNLKGKSLNKWTKKQYNSKVIK